MPPQRRGGFRYWMGYENSNSQHECYVHGTASETPQRLPGYETDALSDLLLAHLRSHVGARADDTASHGGLTAAESGPEYQPFFAVLSVQPPHDPNVGPTNPSHGAPRIRPASIRLRPNVPAAPGSQSRARFHLAGYYAQIENLDYNIGRIRQALAQMGVDRDTYVVFFSDHGDMMGSHGQYGKSTPWEEAIRVPFIVHRAGGAYNMRVGTTDALINHVDIAPTSLGLCNLDTPAEMVGHDYSAHCIAPHAPEFRTAPQPENRRARSYSRLRPSRAATPPVCRGAGW